MSQLVIDASAAVQIASMAVTPPGLARFDCVAPSLMWSEVVSALAAGAFRGDIPASALGEALDRFEALPISVAPIDRKGRRTVLDLARSLGWAKSYDAEYVFLAQDLGCPVVTVDARLVRGAGHLVEMLAPTSLG